MARSQSLELVIRAKDAASKELRKIDRAFGVMRGGVGRVSRAVFSLKTAFVALAGTAGAGMLGKSFLNTASSMEQYKITLGTVLRSHEKAKGYMEWIQEFAASTPFKIPGLVEAATRLKAYGLNAKKYMTTLGDTAAAMGKPMMAAIEMIADASQGEFERMKEFGLRASDVAKRAGYKSVALMTSTRDNLVKGTETLMAMLEERYSGGMIGLSKSWGGMVSNLADHWTQFKQKVMDAGVFEWLKTGIRLLLDKIEDLKKKGRLDEWARSVARGTITAFKAIIEVAADMPATLMAIMSAVSKAWAGLIATMQAPLQIYEKVTWFTSKVGTREDKAAYEAIKGINKDLEEMGVAAMVAAGKYDYLGERAATFGLKTKQTLEEIDKKLSGMPGQKKVETQGLASLPASLPTPAEPTIDVATGMLALAEQQYQARLRLQEEFNNTYHEMVTSTYDLEREKIEEQGKLWEAAGADKIRVAEWTEGELTRINYEQNMARLQFAQQAAGGIAETFRQIAEAGGKQSKEAFMVYKAAAIAEAGISGSLAIMQVYKDPTIPSTIAKGIMAGIIAAQMALQIGMIAGASPPSYDKGGISRQPGVYYAGVPEAHIPLSGGGSVPVEMKQEQRPQEITILNAPSPDMLDAYLATPRGKNAIFNIMGSAPTTVKRSMR